MIFGILCSCIVSINILNEMLMNCVCFKLEHACQGFALDNIKQNIFRTDSAEGLMLIDTLLNILQDRY